MGQPAPPGCVAAADAMETVLDGRDPLRTSRGVRWRTFANEAGQPEHVLVLDGNQQREWPIGELLDQPWLQRRPESSADADADAGVNGGLDSGDGEERVLLHIPESALR
ncbi:MAG TPA: hypothetical protein VHW44_33250 [Pseudonocardiaceae bacterium]|nr:hypothetical protein [Pseudonocardiaceae bacterium]